MKAGTFLLLVLGHGLLAQQPNKTPAPSLTDQVAVDQQPDSGNDVDIQNWINIGDKTVDRLVSLGVDRQTAESFASASENDPSLWVKWQTARASEHERFALLFFPCFPAKDSAYLYALAREGGAWRVTDHIEMDCHYDESVSFETTWIRDPARDEILVHHDCAGRGTGYLEQHFSVFSLSGGRLTTELVTDDVLHSYPTAVERPRDLDQNSTFTVIPVVGSRSRAIEETRSSVLNGRLTVQRRIFRWNAAKGKYVPSAFKPVEASPV